MAQYVRPEVLWLAHVAASAASLRNHPNPFPWPVFLHICSSSHEDRVACVPKVIVICVLGEISWHLGNKFSNKHVNFVMYAGPISLISPVVLSECDGSASADESDGRRAPKGAGQPALPHAKLHSLGAPGVSSLK